MVYRRTSHPQTVDSTQVALNGEAARSDSMTQSSNDLSQEVSKISDLFSSLSERLLGAARQLHSPGSPLLRD